MPLIHDMLNRPPTPNASLKATFGRTQRGTDSKQCKKEIPPNSDLLLLLDDDAPGVLLVAVHDVGHPALDLGRVLAALALGHGDVDVVLAVADLRDGADEELKGVLSVHSSNMKQDK